jgi:hypothetical protein
MKSKISIKYILAVPAFVIATLAAQLANVSLTSAATLTWTGGGDGETFSDAANWSGGQAPITGDSIVLPGIEGEQTVALVNDLVDVDLAGISLSYVSSSASGSTNYTIDTISFADGAGVTTQYGSGTYIQAYLTSIQEVLAEGDLTLETSIGNTDITVAGDLTVERSGSFYPLAGSTITGDLIVSGTQFSAPLSSNITVTQYRLIGSYPALSFSSSHSNFSTPIVVSGTNAYLTFNSLGTYNYETEKYTYQDKSYTLSSPITLNANLSVRPSRQVTVNLTGTITKNSFELTKHIQSEGVLQIAGTPVVREAKTTALDGSQPNQSYSVAENEIATLNGARGWVSVYKGGILKGSGTANALDVYSGALIAPGNSPGTLTVLESLYIDGGEYQAEILNKDAYDKIVVGEESTSSYGAVYLGSGARLNLVLLQDWSITQGDQFTIIDNRSDEPVDGTFDGLEEGTQIIIDGAIFSITYVGGDGNDVVLTALNTGKFTVNTPNTGAEKFSLSSPALIAILGAVTALTLITLAFSRRQLKK